MYGRSGPGRGGHGWARRTVRGAWRGEVERARSAAALALQLRALDAHVQWGGLRRPPAAGALKTGWVKGVGYKSKKALTEEAEALAAAGGAAEEPEAGASTRPLFSST